jgi:hypothetical protein
MSSGKGRLDLGREDVTTAETESAQALHDAAGRVELWLAKVDETRLQARDEVGAEELAPEDLKPYKKGFWPFRKTIDPMADRTRSILADLEAAAEGRPGASASHAEGRAPRPSNVVSGTEPLVKAARE